MKTSNNSQQAGKLLLGGGGEELWPELGLAYSKTIELYRPSPKIQLSLAEHIQQQRGKLTSVDGHGVGCRCVKILLAGQNDLVSCSLVGQICEMPGK